MKRVKIKKRILVLELSAFLFLAACAQEEAVFVDVGYEEGTETGNTTEEEDAERTESGQMYEDLQEETVKVHVCGAVLNPGVYELSSEGRVIDAIAMAGGMTEDADGHYVNLAGRIADAEQIYIPTREEAATLQEVSGQLPLSETGGKVNINTADLNLLCTLHGIGQTRAQSIIDYRQEHGLFRSIEDIMLVDGIKENSFQKIKDDITVN